MMNDSFCRIIAGEIQARPEQVDAAVRLLDEGNTVPFIARYRKEITGGLDDTQLRNLETRLSYLRELEARPMDERGTDFSAPPAHTGGDDPGFDYDKMASKL